ncbi:MAG TPA: tRNA-dihydrouridine synthase [Candidatus Sulfotelmatobacter sp.]|jgi:tRNA-dihydrouridine synthase|nr:tRNA-dihydrouridine synthase [Candidatus Sulfotelmatobacter sp.]
MKSFWQTLPRPFTVLAPLDGVTDVVFRQIITEIGKPDVLFTEFTMCEGLLSKGRERVFENLLHKVDQHPIVAQIWGTKPESFYKVAQELRGQGFAGIDINMGCPVRTVIRDGACSALIHTPELAAEIIQATKEGAGELPVSVKTRIGFSSIIIDEWISFLLKQDIAALTVHLRTVNELSKVPAHWELMPAVKKLRDTLSPQTVLIGNGDIASLTEVQGKYYEYGCDGFMIGRGIFANPWIFNTTVTVETVSVKEKVNLYLYHIALFEKQWQGRKNFALLKKFAKTYINNFPDASAFREKLMEAKTLEELRTNLQNYLEIPLCEVAS